MHTQFAGVSTYTHCIYIYNIYAHTTRRCLYIYTLHLFVQYIYPCMYVHSICAHTIRRCLFIYILACMYTIYMHAQNMYAHTIRRCLYIYISLHVCKQYIFTYKIYMHTRFEGASIYMLCMYVYNICAHTTCRYVYNIYVHIHAYSYRQTDIDRCGTYAVITRALHTDPLQLIRHVYGVATISRLFKIICLFCKRAL